MDKKTAKIAIVNLADMVRIRLIEFTPLDSAYRKLILSYTESILEAILVIANEFGDEDDIRTYRQLKEFMEQARTGTNFDTIPVDRPEDL